MDSFGSANIQVLDKSTLKSRLNNVMQIVDEINFLEFRYLIGFKSSFLLTSIIANKINTLIAPTYTRTCAAATKLAFNNKYKPATLIKTPPNKKAEYTMLSNKTTPNEPIIMIKDKIEKQISCVVTAIDIKLKLFYYGCLFFRFRRFHPI